LNTVNGKEPDLTISDFELGRKDACWFKFIYDSIIRFEKTGCLEKISKRRVKITDFGSSLIRYKETNSDKS
jgi:hypothetical protein